MKIVIIGGGAAGISVAENLVNLKKSNIDLTIINKEKEYPYYRPFLSKCCGLNVPISTFYLKKPEWYEKNNIKLLNNCTTKNIDFNSKIITTSSNEKIPFDKLVIASGSHGFKLPNVDYSTKGIFQLNEYTDVNKISDYIKQNNCKNALVIGGGILGCESANAMSRFKLNTSIIEMMPRIMPRMLTTSSAQYLTNIIEKHNIKIYTNNVTVENKKNGKLFDIKLKTGEKFSVDIVVINVGVRPNIEFLKDTQINIDRGILVNDYMQTNLDYVYACGDIVQFKNNPTIMLWEPALKQGKVIAENICNPNSLKEYCPQPDFVVTYNSFGILLNCIGNPDNVTKDAKEIIITRKLPNNKVAKTFINYFDNKVIFAASYDDGESTKVIRELPKSNMQFKLFDEFIKKYK